MDLSLPSLLKFLCNMHHRLGEWPPLAGMMFPPMQREAKEYFVVAKLEARAITTSYARAAETNWNGDAATTLLDLLHLAVRKPEDVVLDCGS